MLITSRNPAWQGIADPLRVDVLPLKESAELLRTRSGDSDEAASQALAQELGHLPLALEQAAAYAGQYLSSSRSPLVRYLGLFKDRHYELLGRGIPLAYSVTVDASFSLALDRLRETNMSALLLLEICATMATDELSIGLLLSRPEYLPDPLADTACDALAKEEAVASLYNAGLPTIDESRIIGMHRLVQAITLNHLPSLEKLERISQAIELLLALFPDEVLEADQRLQGARLFPHARAVLDHAAKENLRERTGVPGRPASVPE